MTTDTTPEYGTYQGQSVQVLDRFTARADCRVCGGDGYLEGDKYLKDARCGACGGTGKERWKSQWVRVGFLTGSDAGRTRDVLAAGVT